MYLKLFCIAILTPVNFLSIFRISTKNASRSDLNETNVASFDDVVKQTILNNKFHSYWKKLRRVS